MGCPLRPGPRIPVIASPAGARRIRRAALLALVLLSVSAGRAWGQAAEALDPTVNRVGSGPTPPAVQPTAQDELHAPGETAPLDAVHQALAGETRRARDHLATLAAFDAELERRKHLEEEENNTALAAIAGLSAELSVQDPAGSKTTDIYYRVLARLREEREGLRARLEGWGEGAGVPAYSLGLTLDPFDIPQFQVPLRALREMVERVRAETARLRGEELAQRVRALEHQAERVQDLNRLRIAALRKTEFGGWASALQNPSESLAATIEVFDQYGLMGRYELWRRWQSLRKMASLSGVLSALGSLSYALIEGVLVVVFLRWLLGRVRRGAEERRERQKSWWRDRPRGARGWLPLAESLAPWSLFLVGVWAVGRILGGAVQWPEMEFLLLAAYLYGAYRLALDAFSEAIVLAGSSYRILRMNRRRQAEVIGSVRGLLRTGLLIVAILLPVKWMTGAGLLYDVFLWLAILVVCGIAWFTLVCWRGSILDTYCSIGRVGRLSDWLHSSRHGWRAWIAAPVAFVSLVWILSVALAEEAALRYRSTRNLLTDLSRKRLDNEANPAGEGIDAPEPIPARLTEQMVAEGVEGGLLVPRFPGREGLSQALLAWRAGESRGAFLLTGEQGAGKRTWLRHVALGSGVVARASLDRRITSAAELAAFLGPTITGEHAPAWDLDLLRQTLLRGPPRVVVLDACDHLFLSCVGGYRGLDAFLDLVEATGTRVFWLCAMLEAAWAHILATRGHPAPFRWHETLTPWNEEEIRELIRRRIAASGVRAVYDTLRLSGSGMVPILSGSVGLEEDYFRILWDRAMGNPSVALCFFLRSVVPQSPAEVRVGLFEEPEARDLEVGKDAATLLSALMTHGTLTVEETAAALHLPPSLCAIAVGRLEDLGLLRGDQGHYRIDRCWYPTVKRSLKRKNLLLA